TRLCCSKARKIRASSIASPLADGAVCIETTFQQRERSLAQRTSVKQLRQRVLLAQILNDRLHAGIDVHRRNLIEIHSSHPPRPQTTTNFSPDAFVSKVTLTRTPL